MNGVNGQATKCLVSTSEPGGMKVTGKRLRALVERQGYKCALSGVNLTPDVAEADHIIPVSRGGGHDMSNVQVLHASVNRMKGTLEQDEFIEWCRAVAENA